MTERFRLTPKADAAALPFTQRIDLLHNGQCVGTLRWHAPDSPDGVMQITDLAVADGHRRQGHGSTLLKKAYADATAFFAALGVRPRRAWVLVEQKRHVIARAFLSRHGFQHVSTMTNLHRDQDGMIYQKGFD